MKRSILIFVVLAATWLLLSGFFDNKLLLSFGAGSCLFVAFIARRMDRFDGDVPEYRLGFRPLLYLPWLLVEIVKSNLHMARIVLTPRMPIQQHLVRIESLQETEVGRVVYGNSITLTPGTTTLDIRDGELLVHALTKECLDDVVEGSMNRKVAWLEGRVLKSEPEAGA